MLLTHCHVHSELACVTETIMLTVECMCYRDYSATDYKIPKLTFLFIDCLHFEVC